LRAGALTGEAGEAVLTPPGSRLGFGKLFVFGLGPAGQDEAALTQRLCEGLRKVAQAGVREAALQLPPRLSAEAAIRALVEEHDVPARTMIFSSEPQKLIAVLSQVARGQAQVERRVVKVPGPAAKPIATPPPPAAAPAEAPPAPALRSPPANAPVPGKRPAPPPPPPPPPANQSRPPNAPPQRYVPQEPTQNVFDRKRKKP
jgi:hypothetical protein